MDVHPEQWPGDRLWQPSNSATSNDGDNEASYLLSEFMSFDDYDEDDDEEDECDNDEEPQQPQQQQHASLEGVLFWRMGRGSSSSPTLSSTSATSTKQSWFWKRRYVVLDLQEKSLTAYKYNNKSKKKKQKKKETSTITASTTSSVLMTPPTRLHRRGSMQTMSSAPSAASPSSTKDESTCSNSDQVMAFYLPSTADWLVKDVANDPSCFALEMSSSVASLEEKEGGESSTFFSSTGSSISLGSRSSSTAKDKHNTTTASTRFYFKCRNGDTEKELWLRAFGKLDRLSNESRTRPSILNSILSSSTLVVGGATYTRMRTATSSALKRQSFQLDATQQRQLLLPQQSNNATNTSSLKLKERRVVPERCYPHQWMTHAELQQEMEAPSQTFHDLRHNPCRLDLPHNPCQSPIIGTLHLEVLQGLCLPKLGTRRLQHHKTDAVVYVVSGPYAFCTDVIKDRQSPMWLGKTQRACIIPLHHAYARVYVGVFADVDKNTKNMDDFYGRVVLDVARLRPNSTYDVTLPLRLSAHVYSKRKRGAIRLRFRLEYKSVQAALLSYLPTEIPRPLGSLLNLKLYKPNTDTVVTCGSSRAFRNVAITVHGSHLPGRFSFQQLRATLRAVNFTRKSVMDSIKHTVVELREWRNPLLSAFCFLAWMHCIYQNACSLVPAYLLSYLLMLLFRNYARYGMDGPAQRGFIPPSWEELLRGLLHPKHEGIRPLTMGFEFGEEIQYRIDTHQPRGKSLFRAVGFLEEDEDDPQPSTSTTTLDSDHHHPKDDAHSNKYDLEFPFADSRVYPRFTVEDSLARHKKKKRRALGSSLTSPTNASKSNSAAAETKRSFGKLPNIMRNKDSSGMNDYDDEEQRFATAKFIRKTGKSQLVGAATDLATGLKDVGAGLKDVGESLIDAGESFTEATGLNYVVSPVLKGGHYVVSPVIKGGQYAVIKGGKYAVKGVSKGQYAVIKGGKYAVKGVSPVIKEGLQYVESGIKTGYNGIETGIRGLNDHVVSPLVVSPLHYTVDLVRRTSSHIFGHGDHSHVGQQQDIGEGGVEAADPQPLPRIMSDVHDGTPIVHRHSAPGRLGLGDSFMATINEEEEFRESDVDDDGRDNSNANTDNDNAVVLRRSDSESTSSNQSQLPPPNQDIDWKGDTANSRPLTDDLDEIKNLMHEFTFHKFNDRAYVIRDKESRYFGQGKKQESGFGTKKHNIERDLNKLLQVRQYSHSNPVVGRVGQYVEPIVGASHSFLNAFRALFNVVTWRDPFLTFWVSLIGVALVALLFVFPWRLFLFVLGLWFVGPQNYAVRILRKRGILPPKKPRACPSQEPAEMPVPDDQRVFQGHLSQDQKYKPHKPVDPKEVQYVVVPYSPLMYQRFYDWPPEQEYSQVFSHNHVLSSDAAAGDQTDKWGDAVGLPEANDYFSTPVAAVADEDKKTK